MEVDERRCTELHHIPVTICKKVTEAGCSSASVGDSMQFQTLPVTEIYSRHLEPLTDELSEKNYSRSLVI